MRKAGKLQRGCEWSRWCERELGHCGDGVRSRSCRRSRGRKPPKDEVEDALTQRRHRRYRPPGKAERRFDQRAHGETHGAAKNTRRRTRSVPSARPTASSARRRPRGPHHPSDRRAARSVGGADGAVRPTRAAVGRTHHGTATRRKAARHREARVGRTVTEARPPYWIGSYGTRVPMSLPGRCCREGRVPCGQNTDLRSEVVADALVLSVGGRDIYMFCSFIFVCPMWHVIDGRGERCLPSQEEPLAPDNLESWHLECLERGPQTAPHGKPHFPTPCSGISWVRETARVTETRLRCHTRG